ncbi:Peptidase_S8 domain-containing protein/PA domain-containing protein/Inhibitor_I9 domain-containing protein [Cephalotus follicularis]|uniref:Peptidase_S8 domain-containing protein/PA domain-containing protein/Inhibitor_I9 domain-containing protein n=1 Tax=Cephalotus follicularis TaxID=3775 RepID=A0A1Q3BRC5_CEPFO|nr:Peptidase_S8 domain-containing protein/PA domain-containing protein/Inhibitor_I9 domain-containing protein [Cephalotus follicularis]
MWFPKISFLVLLFTLFSLLHAPAFAIKKSYIVYLGSHAHGPQVTTADLDGVTESHYEFLGSFLGSKDKARDAIFYSYKRHINGFAATLEEEEADEIAKHVPVFLNKGKKLHTTHSWDFMLLEKEGVIHSSSVWNQARFGEDTIIANLDTGVWPESDSFSDKGFGPIPSKWKGKCEDDTPTGVKCNRKLIGARYFNKGYEAYGGKLNSTNKSARDDEGHGTHTLSTAGGNFVPGANVFGLGNGTAKGGSPKARVAAYKVCWAPINGSECFDADIMAGFDAAIHDGVDVISVSLGGDPTDYFNDGLAIGAFHAVKNGIVVVCSAGNSGPIDGSVSNVAPWMITVGASTLDREFQAFVELRNGKRLKGTSLSRPLPKDTFYPLISGSQAKAADATDEDALRCLPETLDPKKVKGKILACLRGGSARVDKGYQALMAGAAGMILCNDKLSGNEIIADPHVLPASQITYEDGLEVIAYIDSTDDPLAYITAPSAQTGIKPAPFMASFSSRGPNTVTPQLLKPDITAPGVNIIAAYTEASSPTDEAFDKRKTPYNTESGTSMSCPHVSGVAGLLKTLHPEWSPAAIRSAIVTTARTRDNTMNPMVDGSFEEATPFSYGHGHIRPNRAMDPGLIYDLNVNDYLDFLCASGYRKTMLQPFSDGHYKCPQTAHLRDFNYPSITVHALEESATVTRRVKNVGSPGTYAVNIRNPLGISVSVEPTTLTFKDVGEEKSYNVTLTVKWRENDEAYVFGGLTWTDGKHYVRSPIVVSTESD